MAFRAYFSLVGILTGGGFCIKLLENVRVHFGLSLGRPPVQAVPAGNQVLTVTQAQGTQSGTGPADIVLQCDEVSLTIRPEQVNELLGRDSPVTVDDKVSQQCPDPAGTAGEAQFLFGGLTLRRDGKLAKHIHLDRLGHIRPSFSVFIMYIGFTCQCGKLEFVGRADSQVVTSVICNRSHPDPLGIVLWYANLEFAEGSQRIR